MEKELRLCFWNLFAFPANFLALFLVLVTCNVEAQEKTHAESPFDISSIRIQGLKSFTEEQIRSALAKDPYVLLSAHPLAPKARLPYAIESQLINAFKHQGFADVTVKVEMDDKSQMVVQIDEGHLYKNGSIEIRNTKSIDKEKLKTRLTSKFIPAGAVLVSDGAKNEPVCVDQNGKRVKLSPPVWIRGETSKLNTLRLKELQFQVGMAFADLGYRNAKFDMKLVPDRNSQTVNLEINAKDEGSPVVIDRFMIQGNKKSSSEAIEKFLNLQKGMLLTRNAEMRLYRDLQRSGRFLSSKISVLDPFLDRGYTLVIDVQESKFARSIEKPFDKREQAVLKWGSALSDSKKWKKDLVFEGNFEGCDFKAIVRPDEGFLVFLGPFGDKPKSRLVFVSSRDEVSIYPGTSKNYLKANPTLGTMKLTIGVGATFKSEPKDAGRHITFAYAYTAPDKESKRPPFEFEINLTPAGCLVTANEADSKVAWNGDIMTLENQNEIIEINGKTGELIHYQAKSIDLEISFVSKEYDRALAEVHRRANEGSNAFDSNHPVSSIVAFLFEDDMFDGWASWIDSFGDQSLSKQRLNQSRKFVRRVVVPALKSVDTELVSWLSQLKNQDENRFRTIPHPSFAGTSWMNLIAFKCVPIADQLFPNKSWPWTVWRETGFLMGGRNEFTGQQLSRILASEEIGPFGTLFIAHLLHKLSPNASRALIKRGKSMVDAKHFRKDYQPFIAQEKATGRLIAKTCRILQTLNEEELRELSESLPAPLKGPFVEFAQVLRNHKSDSSEQALSSALGRCWDAGLDLVVQNMLSDLEAQLNFSLGKRKEEKIIVR